MKVLIKTLDRTTNEVQVEPSLSVLHFKVLIWEKTGIQIRPSQQELLCAGRILKNTELLQTYSIKDGTKIVVMHRELSAKHSDEHTEETKTTNTNETETSTNNEATNAARFYLQNDFDAPERTLRMLFNGLMLKLVNLRVAPNGASQRAFNALINDYRFKIFIHIYHYRPKLIQRHLDTLCETSFTLRRIIAKYGERLLCIINRCPTDKNLKPDTFINSLTTEDIAAIERLNSMSIGTDIVLQMFFILHKNEKKTASMLRRLSPH